MPTHELCVCSKVPTRTPASAKRHTHEPRPRPKDAKHTQRRSCGPSRFLLRGHASKACARHVGAGIFTDRLGSAKFTPAKLVCLVPGQLAKTSGRAEERAAGPSALAQLWSDDPFRPAALFAAPVSENCHFTAVAPLASPRGLAASFLLLLPGSSTHRVGDRCDNLVHLYTFTNHTHRLFRPLEPERISWTGQVSAACGP